MVKVQAKQRKGEENFVSCMRHALDNHYGTFKTVGMGGVFVIERGQAKVHIMVRISLVYGVRYNTQCTSSLSMGGV